MPLSVALSTLCPLRIAFGQPARQAMAAAVQAELPERLLQSVSFPLECGTNRTRDPGQAKKRGFDETLSPCMGSAVHALDKNMLQ